MHITRDFRLASGGESEFQLHAVSQMMDADALAARYAEDKLREAGSVHQFTRLNGLYNDAERSADAIIEFPSAHAALEIRPDARFKRLV